MKFKLHDKISALEKVGRHLGMFTEKVESSGKDGGPIELTDARAALLRGIVPNASPIGTDKADSRA